MLGDGNRKLRDFLLDLLGIVVVLVWATIGVLHVFGVI